MKIILTESQYRRVFLNEQSSIDDIIVYFNEDKGTIVEQTARLYRLWANSTPELSKKYGKESEFDLDAIRKPANSGTFEKSFSKGKSQFDKDYLIVPNKYSFKDGVNVISDQNKSLYITQGGRVKYKVNTKKVLPEKLSTDDLIYDSNGNIIRGGKKTDYSGKKVYYTYYEGTGPEIIKKVRNIYSSPNTKRATNVTQKEKESDIEKKLVSFRNTIDYLEDIGLGVRDPLRGRLIPYKKTDTFKYAEDIPSDNYLFARTAINAMKYLDYLKADKTISGVKGDSTVCVTKLGDSCKGAAPYITSNTYTLNLAKVLGNKKIGNYPANYVVYDHGFYFDWGKIVEDLENKFKSDKFSYKSSLFPDGWWNYFTQSYNIGSTGSFNKVVSSINSISSGDIPKINTLNKYEGGGSFISWLESWDEQDWIDAASIILYLIPTPMTWAAATGLEVLNAGISVSKGEYTDAALRSGFLIGGALLSKSLSSSYKVSKEAAEETTNLLTKIDGVSKKEANEIIKKEYKIMRSDSKKLLDDLMNRSNKQISELQNLAKKNQEFMNKIDEYMKPPYNFKESKAVRRAGVDTWGENEFQKYWIHIAPTTKTEAIIMSLLYGGMQLYSYTKFEESLMEKGASKEEVKLSLSKILQDFNVKTEEEVEAALNKCNSALEKYDSYGFIDPLPIYNKFTNNCTQDFESISDKNENEKIKNGGITVKGGGPYDYKIYPDIDSEDSWVYTKEKSSDNWRKGNCETAKIIFKTYCKTNQTFIDTSEGQSCIKMLGGEEWEKAMAFISLNYDSNDEISIEDIDGADEIIDWVIDFTFE
jgi:hypothetical protein